MFSIYAAFIATPWAIPGFLVVFAVALVSHRWFGRKLQMSPWLALALLLSLGAILLITITPSHYWYPNRVSSCYLGMPHLPRARTLLYPNEQSLNILLFVPLGLLCLLARPWRVVAVLLSCSALLPVLIEAYQYALPAFGRICTTVDVFNNLLGLVLGVIIGLVLRLVFSREIKDLPSHQNT